MKFSLHSLKVARHFRLLFPALCATGFLLWANTISAAVLVEYGFGTTSTTFDPTFTDSSLTGSTISTGAGFTGNISGQARSGISTSATGGNPANGLFTRGTSATDGAGTESAAVTNNKYFELTLTPDSGVEMSISSLTFDYRRESASSASGFSLLVGGTTIGSASLTGTGSWANSVNLDLSAVNSLQDLTGPVTFRLYFYGGTADTAITRYDNFTFEGAVVPEPGSGVLILASLGALGVFRRCRTRRIARL